MSSKKSSLKLSSLTKTTTAAAIIVLLSACSDDSDYDFEASRAAADAQLLAESSPQAVFDLTSTPPVIPFPNNQLFAGSTDGTLNLPISADADQTLGNPQVALNQLNGFSTVAPITATVSKALNPDTLILGETVRVFEVTTLSERPAEGPGSQIMEPNLLRSAVSDSVDEIIDPTQLIIQQVGDQLVLIPRTPLKPGTSYMVVLTNGVTGTDGKPLEAGLSYQLLQGSTPLDNPGLEMLRGVVGTHSLLMNTQLNIDPANVALSWVFSTQSVRETLQALKDNTAGSSALSLAPTGLPTNAILESLQGKADVYVGAIALPYYGQTPDAQSGNPLPALNGFWNNASGQVPGAIDTNGIPDFLPVKTTDVTVPVIMTIPNANAAGGGAAPTGGWPVTIFQHGITGNRTQMLAIADGMADAGRAVIAIDMPLHGLTDAANGLHANQNPFGPQERTFGIDVVTQAADGSSTPGPDSQIDSSGFHFYNLQNLANSRDNLRQAIADLFVLRASLATAAFTPADPENPVVPQLNAGNVYFVGHSLGAMVGTTVLSYDGEYEAATLAMPGGGIAQLLAGSQQFGPTINAGLAQAGIETGSADYNAFLSAAQSMVDSGDPINHARFIRENLGTPIHLIQVEGDTVIPNSLPTAPLSGTEPLIRELGLPSVDNTVMDSSAAVRFVMGDHGSLIRPGTTPEVTVEMQSQAASFAISRGSILQVGNAALLEAAVNDN